MNLTVCAAIPVYPENGIWYRAIQPQHWQTALQTGQTRAISSRFSGGSQSMPQFDVLYLAQDHSVALFEVQALLGPPYGNFVPNPAQPWTILNVQVVLRNVADLTDHSSQQSLQTTAQALTGDWLGYQQRGRSLSLTAPTGLAPTQELGAAMYSVPGLEGFKAVSAKVSDKRTLVVFPQKLQGGSFVRFHDQATGRQHTIRSQP